MIKSGTVWHPPNICCSREIICTNHPASLSFWQYRLYNLYSDRKLYWKSITFRLFSQEKQHNQLLQQVPQNVSLDSTDWKKYGCNHHNLTHWFVDCFQAIFYFIFWRFYHQHVGFEHRNLSFLEPEVTIFGRMGGADPSTSCWLG